MSAPTAAMTQSWYRSVIAGLTYASYRGGDTSEAPSLGALSDEKSVCTDMPARCIAECSSSSSVLTDCARSDVSALGAISRLDGCGAVELDASAVLVVIEYGIASAVVEGSSRGRRRLRWRKKTSKAPAARIEATTGTTIATMSFEEARGEVAVDVDVVELDGVAWAADGEVCPAGDIEDEASAGVGELECALEEEDKVERSPKLVCAGNSEIHGGGAVGKPGHGLAPAGGGAVGNPGHGRLDGNPGGRRDILATLEA
ncbi:hypothetical protein AURDEDRAFT_171649 [Auricularia subglabra TFB-10046 SS5]|nr:hypothetical protein AURDEDRAFT_171649 [Auricularia subglabra TFB-10046 SS5]